MAKLFLIMLIISLSSMAKENIVSTQFEISSFSGSSHIYYNAQVAKAFIENVLGKMGAQNIHVQTSGGIDTNGYHFPVFVNADFSVSSNDSKEGQWKDVVFEGTRGCHLMKEVFIGLHHHFAIQAVEMKHCSSPSGAYRVSLQVWQ